MSSSPAGRYLNAILTINAVLLAGIICTQLTGGAAWSSTAAAQTPPPGTPGGGGVPNAGAQRLEMINELAALRASVEGMKKQLESGKMKVVIANVDDFKAAMAAAADKGK